VGLSHISEGRGMAVLLRQTCALCGGSTQPFEQGIHSGCASAENVRANPPSGTLSLDVMGGGQMPAARQSPYVWSKKSCFIRRIYPQLPTQVANPIMHHNPGIGTCLYAGWQSGVRQKTPWQPREFLEDLGDRTKRRANQERVDRSQAPVSGVGHRTF